ncbi:MAG: hypothetical protein ACE14P_04705 [Methanotrichaceae archaeon]
MYKSFIIPAKEIARILSLSSLLLSIFISTTCGLQLTASTGGNVGSSSTTITYGSTVEDFANEHIGLNPSDGTLSNAFSGSGSLPSSSNSICDSSGNSAKVYRSVSGKAVTTRWSYDWSTYRTSSGVGASLSLTASNAYSINGGSSSSNKEGDNAQVDTYVGVSNSQATSQLTNYNTKAEASATQVSASQSFNSASSTGTTTVTDSSYNKENDQANVKTTVTATINAAGTINSYNGNSGAMKTSVSAQSHTDAKSASGSISVYSDVHNTKQANEGLSKPVSFGDGHFGIIRSSSLTADVASSAGTNNVLITVSGLPAGTQTAISLEPYSEYAKYYGGTDMSKTVWQALLNTGYATVRYTDSAASKDKFTGLDKYNVVLIKSHMNSNAIGLSTGTGSSSQVSYSELNYKNPPSHSLMLLAGCSSFKPDSSGNPSKLASAVAKANLDGGFKADVDTAWDQDYIGRIFQNMASGGPGGSKMTFSAAENEAWNSYRLTWCKSHRYSSNDPYIVRLNTYGNTGFML